MDPLRFTFSIKARVRPRTTDAPTPTPLHGDFMKLGPRADASSYAWYGMSHRLISYRPACGLRVLFTRINYSKDLPVLASRRAPYSPGNLP
jgi:hypothetical protein